MRGYGRLVAYLAAITGAPALTFHPGSAGLPASSEHVVSAAQSPAADSAALYSPISWSALNLSVSVSRPVYMSKVMLTDPAGADLGQFNMTGIFFGADAAYRFQSGALVFGPWGEVEGGVIEAMPLDLIIRRNASVFGGGEIGFALGPMLLYGRLGGGVTWASATKAQLPKSDAAISAFRGAVGLDYQISPNWFAGAQATYSGSAIMSHRAFTSRPETKFP